MVLTTPTGLVQKLMEKSNRVCTNFSKADLTGFRKPVKSIVRLLTDFSGSTGSDGVKTSRGVSHPQVPLWGDPFAPRGAHSSTLVNPVDPLFYKSYSLWLVTPPTTTSQV